MKLLTNIDIKRVTYSLCCSRKYSYPSHERFLKLNPPPTPPLWKFHFSVILSFKKIGLLKSPFPLEFPFTFHSLLAQYHNAICFGGLFALKQWIFCSLKHDTVPRVKNLHCFYVKNSPKQIALWVCASSEWGEHGYFLELHFIGLHANTGLCYCIQTYFTGFAPTCFSESMLHYKILTLSLPRGFPLTSKIVWR